MFLLLNAFTRQGADFGVNNYLGACTQGVFSSKVRKEQSSKAFKRVFNVFFLKTFTHTSPHRRR